MLKTRLIAVLILRDGRVVQSVRFKHTNAIHYDPIHAMECFNKWAIDEIVVLNVSRDSASRDGFARTVTAVSASCFVPLAAGGWINDESYAAALLNSGADKLVLNTALADSPALVSRLVRRYGSQCIVASMDVKRNEAGATEVVVDRGVALGGGEGADRDHRHRAQESPRRAADRDQRQAPNRDQDVGQGEDRDDRELPHEAGSDHERRRAGRGG